MLVHGNHIVGFLVSRLIYNFLLPDYNFQNVLLQDENNVSYALFMYGTMNGRNNLMSPTVSNSPTYFQLAYDVD